MARLKAGDRGGFFVTASTQTSGRGRRGRTWMSPPGNLYASLALIDPSPTALVPQLGFVAGVALVKVLRDRLGGDTRIAIKWPNDIVFAGAKVAGLLLESASLPDGRYACVVGLGVNCASHPDGLAYPATNLRVAGDHAAVPDAILAAFGETVERELERWDRGAGFPKIRADWLSKAAGLGESIRVSMAHQTIEGVFEGLDADGRLLIGTANGRKVIEAGDVFLGSAGTARDDVGIGTPSV